MATPSVTDADQKLQVYLAHRSALVDYAAPLLGSRAWAEDVVQEAYLRFAGTASLPADRKPILHPVAYLYRIVRNIAMDWERHRALGRITDLGDDAFHALPSATPTPEQEAIDRDELRVVAEALADLPERTRIAFEQHRMGGRSLQDVADGLGVSVTLVHQMVKKAMTHCAARLDALD
ncbi:DNA-directed RNA polymerase sigma-70 factor [Tistrella bauzanensis]|uniref:DNA-directed RNA polymerase sigma-70 factor n=1 Tax=Tistrella bauzanensis TaxID=657419 RepID=A0ABQ1IH35_9PROT|nr:sigma-70 family RNA polymerase sigma factor [Tistrella bauzanensis]GGB36222.1 DNA-directed RNA polymerase sigma-70 factor [Tistrella bauzanensis]